ncbi:hypothetical protein OC842_006828, partial [Tilletia horrida]
MLHQRLLRPRGHAQQRLRPRRSYAQKHRLALCATHARTLARITRATASFVSASIYAGDSLSEPSTTSTSSLSRAISALIGSIVRANSAAGSGPQRPYQAGLGERFDDGTAECLDVHAAHLGLGDVT